MNLYCNTAYCYSSYGLNTDVSSILSLVWIFKCANNISSESDQLVRRMFGPKRDEATGGWRKLHNEELHNLYSSPSIIRIIKSRRMRWEGHVARMGEERTAYRLSASQREEGH
jgi:hypothetical protein